VFLAEEGNKYKLKFKKPFAKSKRLFLCLTLSAASGREGGPAKRRPGELKRHEFAPLPACIVYSPNIAALVALSSPAAERGFLNLWSINL
jgi:hypothetical protein